MPEPFVLKALATSSFNIIRIPLEVFGHISFMLDTPSGLFFCGATSAVEIIQLNVKLSDAVMIPKTIPLCGSDASFPNIKNGSLIAFKDICVLDEAMTAFKELEINIENFNYIDSDEFIKDACLGTEVTKDLDNVLDHHVCLVDSMSEFYYRRKEEGQKLRMQVNLSPIRDIKKCQI